MTAHPDTSAGKIVALTPAPIEKGLFDLVPCGLVVCSSDGKVLRTNRFFQDISQQPAEAFAESRPFHHYLTRPSRFIFNAQLVPQLIHGGQAREISLDLVGPGNTGIPVLINANLDAASGHQHFAVFPATDRRAYEHEIVKARKEITKSRDYLELAEKLAGMGHWRVDLMTREAHWSPQIFAITGLDPATHVPRMGDGAVTFHDDDRPRIDAILEKAIHSGEDFSYEARLIRHGTGDIRHVRAYGVSERDVHGITTGLFGVFHDITEMAEAQTQITQSEARYRLLADQANDIITIFDLGGIFEYLSPAVATVLGYTADELIGRNVRAIIHPNDFETTQEAYQRYVASRNWGTTPRIQYRAVHKDGHFVWLEAHPKAILDDGGEKIVKFQDVVRDITAQKAVEKELARASIEANAAADAKAQFLATMSHELRTPLTSIIGYSALLRDLLGDNADLRRHSLRIHTAGQGLLSLINDILDHSKLEAGQLELDIAPCSVADLVTDVVDMLALQAKAKSIALQVTGADTLPGALLLDEIRLRQILLNLVSNAVKFTAKGSVSIAMEMHGEHLYMAVRDTGPGIAADKLPRLFQRFSQVHKDTNVHGGTGLGLQICKQLTELMGGTIGIDSVEGEGATFWFEIPAEREAEEPLVIEAIEALPELEGRILVADDHEANLDLVCTLLAQHGYSVDKAGDGAQALKASMEKAYDLILMDVNMPIMDGLVATRGIRATSRLNAHTPILALTAGGDAQLRACLAAGMNDLIDKPISNAALRVAVSSWIYESPHHAAADAEVPYL